MSTEKNPTAWVIGFTSLAITAVLAVWVFEWDRGSFLAWKQRAGPLPFFGALAILPALGFPTTPFYLMAGVTFGTGMGLIGSALSLLVNLVLSYWIAQSGLRPLFEKLLARTRYDLPVIKPGQEQMFTLLVKIMPGVPTFAKNYFISLSGIPFPIYFAISFAVSFTYGAAFIVLGDSLYDKDFTQAAWALLALALLGLGFWWFRRRSKRLMQEASKPE